MQILNTYLQNVTRLFQTGNAREHSYRGDLQQLLNEIINDKEVVVTNEPARIVNVGAPDYSITKKDTVIENDLVTLKLNSEISIINIPLIAWEFYIERPQTL